MRVIIFKRGPITEDLCATVNSPLELFDRLVRWDHYEEWIGYVNLHPDGLSPSAARMVPSERHYDPWRFVLVDVSRKHDLEYVEMKVVELWERAANREQ